jgi:flagellin-like hook-associated protein FlgL
VSLTSISATITSAAPSESPSLKRLSFGARFIEPADRIVTAGVDQNLTREIQALNQISRNAGEVSSILQAASASVTLIDDNLTRMAVLADQAADLNLSSAERGILHEEFAELRAEIDEYAGAAKFANSPILDGANSFSATSIGSNIQSGDGINSLTFDSRAGDEFAASGDSIAVVYNSTSDIFTVTNLSTGRSADSNAVASAPGAGETSDVVIEEFGLTLQLNSSFSTSTDITANNTFQVSGSASNQVDLALRIGTSTGAVDEISVDLQRIRVATLAANLQHDDLLTSATAVNTADSIETAQETIASFQNATRAGLNRISRALDGIENTVSNYEAAKADLIDIADGTAQQLLHQLIAENVNSVLNSTDNVSDALSQFSTGAASAALASSSAAFTGGAAALTGGTSSLLSTIQTSEK